MIADDEKDTARADGLDPRYDPAFQRGYRPQPGERPRTRIRAVATAAGTGATAASPTAAPSRDRSRAEAARTASLAAPAVSEPAWESSVDEVPDLSAPSFPATGERAAAERAGADRAALDDGVAPAAGFLAGVELSPRRNPFMLALWIVGAALVVIGVVVYAVAANASYTNSYSGTASDVSTQVFIQIGWVLAGPMITIGLATLVALLFLTALAGRRKVAGGSDGAEDDTGL